jgi:arabinofuranosyltransferase
MDFDQMPVGTLVLQRNVYVCASIIVAFILMELLRRRRAQLAVVIGCMLFIGFVFSLGLIDDSYISLRFARNFANGHGLVFNVGEKVEGYTCFLWVWLLGLLKRAFAGLDLAVAAKYLGIGLGALGLLVIYRSADLLQRTAGRSQFIASATPFSLVLVAANLPFVFWSFSGMETGLYLLLLVGSTYYLLRYLTDDAGHLKDVFFSSVLLVLACMTRPETYVIPICNLVFVLVREKRRRIGAVGLLMLPFAAIFLPYFIWRYTYYGYLFPNTYYAKVAGGSGALSLFGLGYLVRGGIPHVVFIVFILSKLARRARSLRLGDYYVLAVLAIWVAIVIYTGADHFAELRFFVFMLPFMYLACFDEIAAFSGAVGDGISRLLKMRSRGPVKRIPIALLAIATFLGLFYYHSLGLTATVRCGRHLADRWSLVGKWLQENSGPGDVIATPVVGAIGYYCDRTIVDMLGIVDGVIAHTPNAAPGTGPKDHNRFNSEYVLSRNPTYIYLLQFRPSEQAFLERPSRIPALQDLKRYFPNDAYKYMTLAIGQTRHSIYVRTDKVD